MFFAQEVAGVLGVLKKGTKIWGMWVPDVWDGSQPPVGRCGMWRAATVSNTYSLGAS